MYHFFLGVLENPACVLNFPLPLLICPLSCLKGPPSDVVLEAVAYRDVIPTLSRLSRSSPIHLLASQLSPIAFLSHLSSLAFGFFSQDRLQTCGTICPRCPPLSLTHPLGFSRSFLLLTRFLLSLLSCLLFPLGSHSGTSIVSQYYHLHLCTRSIGTSSHPPEGSPRQEYQVLSLVQSPRTVCLSV